MLRIIILKVVSERLSEADGSNKRSANTGSTISLCVASTSAPMSLQEHEVLQRHHSAGRVRLHGVEDVDAELVARCKSSSGRRSFCKVREQCDVAVWI